MSRYDLPEWVKIYKEKGKSIKVKSNQYYLYETKCIYDNKKKHKNITKNIYLGKITQENGLIPARTKTATFDASNIVSKVYGTYKIIEETSKEIKEKLTRYFGKEANRIFTIAALRAIENTPYYELEDSYNETYFSEAYKGLSMSKTALSELLQELANNKNAIVNYMREDIDKKEILIFDGTNIFCGSRNISYVASGYKHGHNYKTQVNIMYAYSSNKNRPVYYKLFEGSITDKTALKDLISEANIKGNTILIDTGFASKSNVELIGKENRYIMALRRDSKYVTGSILNDSTREKADSKFINNAEAIYAYDTTDENGNRICIYFNQAIASKEATEYISKMNRNWKGYNEENHKEAIKRFGIYVIKTNIKNLSLKSIYEYYKSRYEIEYMFDTLKNTLECDKTYMHSDVSLESWAFINHITISIIYKLYELLRTNDLLTDNPPRKIFKKLKQVVMCKNILDKQEGNYHLQVIPAKIRKLLENLSVIL
jgi:transposase